jgi:hypothetical protein
MGNEKGKTKKGHLAARKKALTTQKRAAEAVRRF